MTQPKFYPHDRADWLSGALDAVSTGVEANVTMPAQADANGRAIRALAKEGSPTGGADTLHDGALVVEDEDDGLTFPMVRQVDSGGVLRDRWRVGAGFANLEPDHQASFSFGSKISTAFAPLRVYAQLRFTLDPGGANDSRALLFSIDEAPLTQIDEVRLLTFTDAGTWREAEITCAFEPDGVTLSIAGDPNVVVSAAAIAIAGPRTAAPLGAPSSQRIWAEVDKRLDVPDYALALNDNLRAIRDRQYGPAAPPDAQVNELWADTATGFMRQFVEIARQQVWVNLWPLETASVFSKAQAADFSFGSKATTPWAPTAALVTVECQRAGRGAGSGRFNTDAVALLFVGSSGQNKTEQIAVGQNDDPATALSAVTIQCAFAADGVTITKSGGGGSGLASVVEQGLVMFA